MAQMLEMQRKQSSNVRCLWRWVFHWRKVQPIPPWKINMEPEIDGLEDDFPLQLGDF